ncbi:MAG: hypothetical protein KJ058_05655 [Thermoanaerobaculia bacterium]|nr:hypothetical protein [Thermoanaerobaculia bacterium]
MKERHEGGSEYTPLFGRDPSPEAEAALARVRREFRAAGDLFLASPLPWLGWAAILPGLALATPAVALRFGPRGVLLLWSLGVLAGGGVEMAALARAGALRSSGPLSSWVLRGQGNLSLVGAALSALLIWLDAPGALPGLWLLLVGHSFFLLGGLAFPPLRLGGVLYQLGGAVALWPGAPSLPVFAVATAAANLWIAWAVWARRGE